MNTHGAVDLTPAKQDGSPLSMPGDWSTIPTEGLGIVLPQGTQLWDAGDLDGLGREIKARWPELDIVQCYDRCFQFGRCEKHGHSPFMVVQRLYDGTFEPLLGFSKFDQRLLNYLSIMDSHKEGGTDAMREAAHQRNQRMQEASRQEFQDRMQAALSMAKAALTSHKCNFTVSAAAAQEVLGDR